MTDTPPDPARILDALDALQRDLSAAQERDERAERLETLGTLSAMIAHEVRGIASKIVGNAQLIARDAGDPDRCRDLAERIARLGLHAGRVAETILAAADEPIPGDACVIDVHRRSLDALPSDARARLDDSGVDPTCRASIDPDALERVLVNLYLNAWRAVGGSGGSGLIRVSTRRRRDAAGTGHIELRIADEGPGVPRDLGGSIFEPWNKGHGGTGHGLGLALCKHLIEAAGGSIRLADPRPDHGAEVVLTLTAESGRHAERSAAA